MSTTVSTAFIDTFNAETKLAYQRMGAKLRPFARTVTNVNGSTHRFPLLGKGVANSKGRHADLTPMNLAHTNVTATLSDHYAPEYLDVLDEFKSNEDFRGDYSMSASAALGRKEDELQIDQLEAETIQGTAGSGGDLTTSIVFEAREYLDSQDVPMDPSRRVALIAPSQFTNLITETNFAKFANADYSSGQPIQSGTVGQWHGFTWVVHTGLPVSTSNHRSIFFYDKMAIGLAIGKDITMSVDYVPQKAAYLINGCMSMGAVVIDSEGIYKRTVTES